MINEREWLCYQGEDKKTLWWKRRLCNFCFARESRVKTIYYDTTYTREEERRVTLDDESRVKTMKCITMFYIEQKRRVTQPDTRDTYIQNSSL